jgi:hypothetical protein
MGPLEVFALDGQWSGLALDLVCLDWTRLELWFRREGWCDTGRGMDQSISGRVYLVGGGGKSWHGGVEWRVGGDVLFWHRLDAWGMD